MSLGRKTALLLAAIAVFTIGALAAVWLATDPGRPEPTANAPASGWGSGSSDARAPGSASPAPALPPEVGIAAPPEWRAQHPTVPVPVPNAAPPVEAPPPAGIPTEPAEREDAILQVRRDRFADQMQRLNRRTQQRGGQPGDAGARPPARTAPPGPAASRRATLSGAD